MRHYDVELFNGTESVAYNFQYAKNAIEALEETIDEGLDPREFQADSATVRCENGIGFVFQLTYY